MKWALVTETLTLKLPGTTLDGSKGEGKAKTETPHIHATPFEARRGGRYEVHVQPVRRSAETKALPSVSGLKLFVLPPKANTINQAVARADRANKDGKQHLAFIAAATGAHFSKLTASCSHSFSQSNSVPYIWGNRHFPRACGGHSDLGRRRWYGTCLCGWRGGGERLHPYRVSLVDTHYETTAAAAAAAAAAPVV
eukprot:COSAG03_NODE_1768_length_3548_cov_20.584807_1_plen_196_part_00